MIELSPMTERQTKSWLGLLDVAASMANGWTVVGGQMVQLHCFERGAFPTRPTEDADVVLDVRTQPDALTTFTKTLTDYGFVSAGESWEGHQHRWVRDGAVIDILIPRHLGVKASSRRGVSGGTTLETPGAQSALNRSQPVEVLVDGRSGFVHRPDLFGAIAAKSAAFTVQNDRYRQRHLIDVLTLALLIDDRDASSPPLTPLELERIRNVLNLLQNDPIPGAAMSDRQRSIDLLALVVG